MAKQVRNRYQVGCSVCGLVEVYQAKHAAFERAKTHARNCFSSTINVWDSMARVGCVDVWRYMRNLDLMQEVSNKALAEVAK